MVNDSLKEWRSRGGGVHFRRCTNDESSADLVRRGLPARPLGRAHITCGSGTCFKLDHRHHHKATNTLCCVAKEVPHNVAHHAPVASRLTIKPFPITGCVPSTSAPSLIRGWKIMHVTTHMASWLEIIRCPALCHVDTLPRTNTFQDRNSLCRAKPTAPMLLLFKQCKCVLAPLL